MRIETALFHYLAPSFIGTRIKNELEMRGQRERDKYQVLLFNAQLTCLHLIYVLIFLTFSVPPKKPTIFNERGEEALGTVGPYMIGDAVSLKCIVVGGE